MGEMKRIPCAVVTNDEGKALVTCRTTNDSDDRFHLYFDIHNQRQHYEVSREEILDMVEMIQVVTGETNG